VGSGGCGFGGVGGGGRVFGEGVGMNASLASLRLTTRASGGSRMFGNLARIRTMK
jgi:hypothetical protein